MRVREFECRSSRPNAIQPMSACVQSSKRSIAGLGCCIRSPDSIPRWFLQKLSKDLAQANKRNKILAVRYLNNYLGISDH